MPAWCQVAANPQQLNLSFEDVSSPSHADLTLRRWLIPSLAALKHEKSLSYPSEVAIVCVHCANRDSRALLRHSIFPAEAGYSLVSDPQALYYINATNSRDFLDRWTAPSSKYSYTTETSAA